MIHMGMVHTNPQAGQRGGMNPYKVGYNLIIYGYHGNFSYCS